MIELKRLKLINWHNFENTTFDCARLTYMIGVNAVGKTTILDAIRYCLTTNRNFNALGNKKSGRTLQGSVHAKQRGENAYRRPGHTVAYIGAEFWDSVKHTSFVIAVRVESEGPMQELHPGDQTWYISEDGITLEQLPFIDPRTGAPSARKNSSIRIVRFPVVMNLRKLKSFFSSPNAPSTWIERFILSIIPRSLVMFCKETSRFSQNVFFQITSLGALMSCFRQHCSLCGQLSQLSQRYQALVTGIPSCICVDSLWQCSFLPSAQIKQSSSRLYFMFSIRPIWSRNFLVFCAS